MAHRHDVHKRAKGGRVVYAGGESNVAKEAEENLHKRGGKVMGKVHGHKGKHRIAKKRGGGVGSDNSPFTSANRAAKSFPGGTDRKSDPSFVGAAGK